MEELLRVKGIVLKHRPVGDYDLVVTFFTREKGKISAFAKGVRRMNNALSGTVEPFCFGDYRLYPGRSSYTVKSAHVTNYFEGFRKDPAKAWMGMYFLEIADYYTRENNEDPELLKLLYQSLRALLSPSEGLTDMLVRTVYELRCFAIEGELYAEAASSSLSGPALYALNHITSAPVERLYTFTLSGEVLAQLRAVADDNRRRLIDRPLKTLEMIDMFGYN